MIADPEEVPPATFQSDESSWETVSDPTDQDAGSDEPSTGGLSIDSTLPDEVNQIAMFLAGQGEYAVGEFTFGGSAQDLLPGMAGLEVDGFGLVPLPLTDSDLAGQLATCGRLAPFGRGSETITDTAIRHTWQFERGQIRLTNPDWDRGRGAMTAMIAERLGCPGLNLGVHLYKLLLYGPGSHFVKHQDTEKEEGMFATLVIQLPSEHKGGELVVYDHQQDREDGGSGSTQYVHDFGAKAGTAAFAPHYAVHFADADHELKPVTEGYRLALVYSLCWPSDLLSQPDLHLAQASRAQLAGCLKSLSDTKSSLHYFLAHSYTEASIARFGLQALKGTDRHRIQSLVSANRALDPGSRYSFYLLRAHRTIESRNEESEEVDSQGHSTSETISGLYAEDGTDLPLKHQDKLDDLVDQLGFLVNPDAKHSSALWWGSFRRESSYTGNEGNEVTTVYEKYIALMVPANQGEWGLAPIAGIGATFERLIPDPEMVTAAQLDGLIATLPLSLQQRTIQQGFYGGKWTYREDSANGVNLTAKLLNLVVARKFEECIPTYFEAIECPLTAAMLPAYVKAMKLPGLWAKIEPLLLGRVAAAPNAFSLSVSLARVAMESSVPESIWAGFLKGIKAANVPFDRSDKQYGFGPLTEAITWAMRTRKVWRSIGFDEWVVRAMSECEDESIFHLGLHLVISSMDKKDMIDDTDMTHLLAALGSRKQISLADPWLRQQLQLAIQAPRIWQSIFPVVRNTFALAARSDGESNAFEHCLQLILALASTALENTYAWDPLLDVMSAIPLSPAVLAQAPAQQYYHSMTSTIRSMLISAMTHPRRSMIWPAIRTNVVGALSQCAHKFDVGFSLIRHFTLQPPPSQHGAYYFSHSQQPRPTPSDWLDEQTKQQVRPAWIDLVPPTFAPPFAIETTRSSDAQALQATQEQLWPMLIRAGHVPSIQAAVAAYCAAADGVHSLKAPARVLLRLRQLPELPRDVVQVLAPMIDKYVDEWALPEKRRLKDTLAGNGAGMYEREKQDLEVELKQVAEDVRVWESVKAKNVVGAR